MVLINVTPGPNDANDGEVRKLDYMIGNRRWGQKTFISGVEAPLPTTSPAVAWQAFEAITVAATAIGFTEGLAENATEVLVTVESNAVRYRVDGQAPTATVGHVLNIGDVLRLSGFWEIDQFRAIRRDAGSAVLAVSYGNAR